MNAIRGRLERLEAHTQALAAVKMANVGLAMLWGFAVTFVFVRLLPLAEFRAFLLLIAFANFTISADFGFSSIIYARLRRHRLNEGSDFRPGEMAILLAFMAAVVVLGGALIGGGLATGHIATGQPGLFLAFYILCAFNIFALLAKRAMAAIDANFIWEAMDLVRRLLSLALLLASLWGLSIVLSVIVQTVLIAVMLLAAFSLVHRAVGMTPGEWLPRRAMLRHATGTYLHDMGATMALTLSDVAAYNAPYFTLAAVTHDPRPLLVFDFVFKISRALSAIIRAMTEAMLPRLTAAFHQGRDEAFRAGLYRLLLIALGAALALGLFLTLFGPLLSRVMFAGKAVLTHGELGVLTLLLLGLALMCVSTYVQNALGRFRWLLVPSLFFLIGSAVSAPLAAVLMDDGLGLALGFLCLFAACHLIVGARHMAMLRGLMRP